MTTFHLTRLVSLGALCATLASFAKAQDSATKDAPITMNEFNVTSSQDTGYRATNSISGTRLNQKLSDVAQNIQVITSDFINDIQATELVDALQYTPGVVGNNSANENAVNVRGMDSLRPLRNGITTSGTLAIDAGVIDRVEVVKGPSSVLYGVAGVGGLVNYITKRPGERMATELSTMYASFGKVRGQIDVNLPLIPKKLLFRSIYIHDRGKAYIGNGYTRDVIASSVIWNITTTTSLYVNFENLSQFGNEARLNPQGATGPGYLMMLPRDFNWSGPSYRKSSVVNINADLTQRFGQHWLARAIYNQHVNNTQNITVTPAARATATNTITLTPSRTGLNRFPNYAGRIETTGRYTWGQMESITLLGGERSYNRLTQATDSMAVVDRPVWNLNDPTTWGNFGDLYNGSKYTVVGSRLDRTQQFTAGFFTQQLAFFNGRVRLTGGIRHDSYDVEVRNFATGANNPFHASSNPPILSLLVKPIEPVSLYVLSSKSINTNVNQFDALGRPFPPQYGKGIEAGSKFDLWSGRVSGSFSMFRNERTNIPEAVLGSNPTVFVLAGRERVDGTEESLFFFPTSEIQIIAAHSYLDGRVVEDANPANVGAPVSRLSKNSYSLWTKYAFKQGDLKGLWLAGGWSYRDSFPTTTAPVASRTVLPGYGTVDLSAGYSHKFTRTTWSLGLKVGNLFDRDFRNGNGVPQPLRNYSLSSSLKY